MPVVSHPQLALLPGRSRWRRKMTHISDQPFSILWDPGAVIRDDAIFSSDAISSDESLLLDVNFHSKISRRPKISRRQTAPGSPTAGFKRESSGKTSWADCTRGWPAVSYSNSRWRKVSAVVQINVLKMRFAKGYIYSVFFKVKPRESFLSLPPKCRL